MATESIEFAISFMGGMADNRQLNLYDAAQALVGFQRSLALTTHLLLNDEVITQAPSLKGADIISTVPTAGSWKLPASVVVLATTIYTAGMAPRDSPVGNLVSSAYDYVVSESLGFHVDYSKTLGQQYEELHRRKIDLPELSPARFDSVIEKCEVAIRDMHRPIAWSGTANQARVTVGRGSKEKPIGPLLNMQTYEYIRTTKESPDIWTFRGRISSYNINTFKGRVFISGEGRPIPFELAVDARVPNIIGLVTESLALNAQSRKGHAGDLQFRAFRRVSHSGRLKGLLVVEVAK
jgi:hypothetical protein